MIVCTQNEPPAPARTTPDDDTRQFGNAFHVRPWDADVIYFATFKSQERGRRVRDDRENQFVETRHAGFEIIAVAFERDLLAFFVFDKLEWSCADWLEVRRVILRIGSFVEMLGQNRRFDHVELLQERRIRGLETKKDREIIRRFDLVECPGAT